MSTKLSKKFYFLFRLSTISTNSHPKKGGPAIRRSSRGPTKIQLVDYTLLSININADSVTTSVPHFRRSWIARWQMKVHPLSTPCSEGKKKERKSKKIHIGGLAGGSDLRCTLPFISILNSDISELLQAFI